MCNRYSFVCSAETLNQQLGLDIDQKLKLSYNIAPTQRAYVICNDKPTQLQHLLWGLIPYWIERPENNGKLANARRERISSTPSFRIPIRQRRCLVLADSYYSWQRKGIHTYPHRVTQKGKSLMLIAGVWDIWEENGKQVKSFSIITRPASNELAIINSRMPVIFSGMEMAKTWLSDIKLEEVQALLDSPVEGQFEGYRISDRLNVMKYDAVDIHDEVIELPPDLKVS